VWSKGREGASEYQHSLWLVIEETHQSFNTLEQKAQEMEKAKDKAHLIECCNYKK
jgi:hypothetical protein